jgi:hypothetical protein
VKIIRQNSSLSEVMSCHTCRARESDMPIKPRRRILTDQDQNQLEISRNL